MASKKLKPADSSLIYGEGTERLSQLSDIISLSQEAEPGSQPVLIDAQLRCSQTELVDLHEPLPSQAVLPTPELTVEVQRIDKSGAREPERTLSRFAEESVQQMLLLPHSTGSMPTSDARDRKRRVTRRGPMDEMRQLVRILSRIIPHSEQYLKACEEGGGGNRITEEQIKTYLSKTLGDAPQPKWGVPEGWPTYLAELFSWVAGRPITRDQAMQCAKRDPGRSWEAIDSELARLRLLPSTWPLPLSKESLGSALIPTSQDLVAPQLPQLNIASPKRSPEQTSPSESPVKRLKMEAMSAIKDDVDEVALWKEALQLVQTASNSRSGLRSSSLDSQMAVARIKAEILTAVQAPSVLAQPGSMPLFLASQAPQVVPISLAGPHGQVQTAYTLQLSSPFATTASSSLSGIEPSGSLDLGGLNPSQFLLSQPGIGSNSAFQAVKPGSPEKSGQRQSSPLLDSPPPLRLSQRTSQTFQDSDHPPASPSTEDDDNSAVFNPSQLASPNSGPVSNLFKPTALKSDQAFLERSASQSESRPLQCASPPHVEIPGISTQLPVLGYIANGHFIPLAGGSSLQSLPHPVQPVFSGPAPFTLLPSQGNFQATMTHQSALSQSLENARFQAASWVPNLTASLQ